MHKKVDPDISGKPHDNWHEYNQCAYNGDKRHFQVSLENEIANYKGSNRKGNANSIAHVHGAIEKRRFNAVFGATMRTVFINF